MVIRRTNFQNWNLQRAKITCENNKHLIIGIYKHSIKKEYKSSNLGVGRELAKKSLLTN